VRAAALAALTGLAAVSGADAQQLQREGHDSPAFAGTAEAFANGGGKTGLAGKIGFELYLLSEEHQLGAAGTLTARPARHSGLTISGDSVVVDIATEGDPAVLAAELAGLGLRNSSVRGRVISGLLPASAIRRVGDHAGVRFMRPAQAIRNVGATTSQGDAAQRSDDVRALGFDGAGIKVGVLSDSYNFLGGAAADVASGDLPGVGNPNGFTTPIQVLEDNLVAGNIDEGRAMLQIVHDVAPASELAFATAFTGQAGFANNILALQAAGCDVIVDDVFYLTEPWFQDGIIAQAVDSVVAAGSAYFSSAGNTARRSYEAAYSNSGTDFGGPFVAHDFGGGDLLQTMTFPVGSTTLVLQWDDPFFSVSGAPGADTDLDLALFTTGGTFLFGAFTATLGGDPVEILQVNNGGAAPAQAALAIGKFAGPDPGRIKLIAFRSGFTFDEHNTASGTSVGHANAAGASSVGAAFWGSTPEFGVTPPVLESFSSAGGVPILFDTAGNLLGAPEVRQTPDLVAPDGGNTTFFGTDTGFDADAFPNFFGTSAAAPHAAAVAALLLDAHNGALTPAQVYSALEDTAVDMLGAGYDLDSGHGLINAFATLGNAPLPGADAVTRNPDRTIKIALAQLLGNDVDANGDALSITAVSGLTGQNAVVTIDNGWVTYLPEPGNNNPDSFTYTVDDGNGNTSNGTVLVNVAGIDAGAATPNLIGAVMSGPDVILHFVGVPGRPYRVQYTSSLTPPVTWNDFAPAAVVTANPANGRFTHLDPSPPPPRFYRAIEEPAP